MAEKITYEELTQKVKELSKELESSKNEITALKGSENYYRAFFEHGMDGVVVLDPDTAQPINFNDQACRQLGYSREEFAQLRLSDIEVKETAEEAQAHIQTIVKNGFDNFESLQRTKNGETRHVHVLAQVIDIDGCQVYHCIWRDITDYRQTAEALHESEQRYRRLAENSPDMMYRMSLPDGKYEYVSPAAASVFGYPPEAWYDNPFLIRKIIHPDWHSYFEKQWENLLKGHVPPTYEYKIIHKDESIRWINQRNILVKDDKGRSVAIEGVATDITERNRTEEALKESEEKFRSAFASSGIGMALVDIKGKFVTVNDKIIDMLGYSEQEILNKKFMEVTHPDDLAESLAISKGLLSGEYETFEIEKRYIHKKGHTIWGTTNLSTIKDKEGKHLYSIAQLQDITERKRSEESIRESEERYRDIFDNLMDVYFKTTLNGTIENASPSAKAISGYSPAELTGKKVDMLYHNPKDKEGLLAVLMQKGQARGYEILFKKKNGELYHTSINADLNYNKEGEPISLTGTIRDITESKQAEKEKILAQKIAGDNEKLALVGQIAGKMAHDFNNVLGIIMGNTELSLLDCTDAQIKKTLELIYQQTIRGKNLTKNLVAFARDQEPKQEFFRINEKIDLVINLLKKDLERIELIKEDKPGVPDLLADPGMIEHTLINLIQNSIHATSMIENPKIIMRTYCFEDNICFEIEDNGCGIPIEHLSYIFEPSFTLKGNKDSTGAYESTIKGTGYGMSNVKKYIELHKGTILFESKIDSGTKFTIRLPIIKKELTSEEKIEIRKEIEYFKKRILLVEDETAISDIQYNVLTQEPSKHKVDIAHNGKVAMDLFDRNEYDFISLDYVLPGKINGMDVYNHIRKTNKSIPILFISGNIEFLESLKDLKQKDENIDHQSKPCQNKDYVKSINKLLKGSITS